MSEASSPGDWLRAYLERHGAIAGTVHRRDGDSLELVAAHNIPDVVLEKTRTIPRGKGMAGLALERDEPVTTCNLKTDESGDVRPGARAVDAQAAVALPVRSSDGTVRAVVGLAFAGQKELTPDELATFVREAGDMPA